MPDVRDQMTEKEVRADDNPLIPDPWHLSSDNDRGRDAQTATPLSGRSCDRPVGDSEKIGVRAVHPRSSRKEVIQPQVPLRLPCYDFTPVADLTVAGCLLAVSAPF